MASHAQSGAAGGREPSAAEIFDPIEFERRLVQARERRARLLEARQRMAVEADAAPPRPLPLHPRRRATSSATLVRTFAGALLLAGLGGGLAAAMLQGERQAVAPERAAPTLLLATAAPAGPSQGPAPGLPEAAGTVAAVSVPSLDPLAARTRAGPLPDTDAAHAPAPAGPDLAATRLRVHAPRSLRGFEVRDVVGALDGAGFARIDRTWTRLTIGRSNVRYFHRADRRAAERAAATLGGSHDARARDFTAYRPSPPRGTLELWLAGEGSRARGRGGQTGAAARDARASAAPRPRTDASRGAERDLPAMVDALMTDAVEAAPDRFRVPRDGRGENRR
jgi:hypothetical protein